MNVRMSSSSHRLHSKYLGLTIDLLHGSSIALRFTRNLRRKSANVQSFGIKIERIDRDLLWVYVTAVGRLYI